MSFTNIIVVIILIAVVILLVYFASWYGNTYAKKHKRKAERLNTTEHATFRHIYGLPVDFNTEIELFACQTQFVLYKPFNCEITIDYNDIIDIIYANKEKYLNNLENLSIDNTDKFKNIIKNGKAYLIINYESDNNSETIILDGTQCKNFCKKIKNKDENTNKEK